MSDLPPVTPPSFAKSATMEQIEMPMTQPMDETPFTQMSEDTAESSPIQETPKPVYDLEIRGFVIPSKTPTKHSPANPSNLLTAFQTQDLDKKLAPNSITPAKRTLKFVRGKEFPEKLILSFVEMGKKPSQWFARK